MIMTKTKEQENLQVEQSESIRIEFAKSKKDLLVTIHAKTQD